MQSRHSNVTAAGLLAAATLFMATPSAAASLNGDADQCFDAANRAAAGADPSTLSTAPCRRALRHEPISRADRSAMLHNRGVIERAKGDLHAAIASFASAVRLSTVVDQRNLALAQVAHRLGHFDLALQQYDLWMEHGPQQQRARWRNRIQEGRREAAAARAAATTARRE